MFFPKLLCAHLQDPLHRNDRFAEESFGLFALIVEYKEFGAFLPITSLIVLRGQRQRVRVADFHRELYHCGFVYSLRLLEILHRRRGGVRKQPSEVTHGVKCARVVASKHHLSFGDCHLKVSLGLLEILACEAIFVAEQHREVGRTLERVGVLFPEAPLPAPQAIAVHVQCLLRLAALLQGHCELVQAHEHRVVLLAPRVL
mmetsp:Transcript_95566/g.270375  ORF Transcript_95566/g.270375 Transcript_95566/m.270375 type:complete len:201 (-) Transcript_95566:1408-2010(-)